MSVIKKKIFINAATVKISGGLIVAISYIEALCSDKQFKIFLICPKIHEYQQFEKLIPSIQYVPDLILIKLFRWILDFFWLPNSIKKIKPDIVLSLGNIPVITSNYQIFLHDNPYFSNGTPKELELSKYKKLTHRIRNFYTRKRLKYVNEIWVQTELEQKLLTSKINSDKKIKVISPLIPLHLLKTGQTTKYLAEKPADTIRLICLANYFEHKNIEILFKVLLLAKEQNYKLQIVFTLSSKTGKRVFQTLIAKNNMSEQNAINIGQITSQDIVHVVKQCDGVILPSIMETFGLNCFDAWKNDKPYFISDLSFAREVCNDAAIYIDPLNKLDILAKIKSTFNNQDVVMEQILRGQERIDLWPGPKIFLSELQKTVIR